MCLICDMKNQGDDLMLELKKRQAGEVLHALCSASGINSKGDSINKGQIGDLLLTLATAQGLLISKLLESGCDVDFLEDLVKITNSMTPELFKFEKQERAKEVAKA